MDRMSRKEDPLTNASLKDLYYLPWRLENPPSEEPADEVKLPTQATLKT